MNRTHVFVAGLVLSLLDVAANAAVTTTVVDIPTRPGVMQRILYVTPPAPVAHVIFIWGGDIPLQIRSNGTVDSFLGPVISRAAPRWGAQGISFTAMDVPSDRSRLDVAFRSTLRVVDVLAVAHYLRQRAAVPVWLFGSGAGNVEAIRLATDASLDFPLGLVLGTPHITGAASLLSFNIADVRQPTLVLTAAEDLCPLSTQDGVAGLVAALVNAPVKENVAMTGGPPTTAGPCEDVGPHGWEGLDTIVVGIGGAWISKYNPVIGGATSPAALAIEFYHPRLDHYFISASLPDLVFLGTGRATGWVPTLEVLPVAIAHRADTMPVCRFYIPPAFGDSHFYSASSAECMDTAAKFPWLDLESTNVFEIGLPDPAMGTCPAGMTAVYRIWNRRADSNHRYTLNASVRDQMVARGGVVEGYGQPAVAMCSPL